MAKQKAEEQREQVEEEAAQEQPAEKITRAVAAARAIKEMAEESDVGRLSARADELFVKAGGKTNLETAESYIWAALETMEELGIVETVSVVRRQKD